MGRRRHRHVSRDTGGPGPSTRRARERRRARARRPIRSLERAQNEWAAADRTIAAAMAEWARHGGSNGGEHPAATPTKRMGDEWRDQDEEQVEQLDLGQVEVHDERDGEREQMAQAQAALCACVVSVCTAFLPPPRTDNRKGANCRAFAHRSRGRVRVASHAGAWFGAGARAPASVGCQGCASVCQDLEHYS